MSSSVRQYVVFEDQKNLLPCGVTLLFTDVLKYGSYATAVAEVMHAP